MNLNFYSPNHAGNLESLQTALQDQITKLDQIRNIHLSNYNKPQNQNTQQSPNLNPQRYYVDCGIKEDWDEFLRIHYNLTEKQIFEDYMLFLQAKAEIYEDANKEKLETMKKKLIAPDTSKEYKIESTVNEKSKVTDGSNNTNNSYKGHISNNGQKLEKNMQNNENRGVNNAR